MDKNRADYLKNLRIKAGLKSTQVDQLIRTPFGTVDHYEAERIRSVPMSILTKLFVVYRLKPIEIWEVILWMQRQPAKPVRPF